mmetsp:Transcript_26307/g.91511  ORF Transcript_26307/g.91511 Transcript_26307/m.91511 type:complete len:260 (-) Transcript_26307:1913-2692(-)
MGRRSRLGCSPSSFRMLTPPLTSPTTSVCPSVSSWKHVTGCACSHVQMASPALDHTRTVLSAPAVAMRAPLAAITMSVTAVPSWPSSSRCTSHDCRFHNSSLPSAPPLSTVCPSGEYFAQSTRAVWPCCSCLRNSSVGTTPPFSRSCFATYACCRSHILTRLACTTVSRLLPLGENWKSSTRFSAVVVAVSSSSIKIGGSSHILASCDDTDVAFVFFGSSPMSQTQMRPFSLAVTMRRPSGENFRMRIAMPMRVDLMAV